MKNPYKIAVLLPEHIGRTWKYYLKMIGLAHDLYLYHVKFIIVGYDLF